MTVLYTGKVYFVTVPNINYDKNPPLTSPLRESL